MTDRGEFLFDLAVACVPFPSQRKTPTTMPYTVIEIGGIRDSRSKAYVADGHSTLRWPAWWNIFTVDADLRAIGITHTMAPHAFCVHDDGLSFLRRFPHYCDVLYLDGPHPIKENGMQFALDCFVAAQSSMLKRNGLVLIDDCDLVNRGKGGMVISVAHRYGYEVIADSGRQVLLQRTSDGS